jgi:hypothetical protein
MFPELVSGTVPVGAVFPVVIGGLPAKNILGLCQNNCTFNQLFSQFEAVSRDVRNSEKVLRCHMSNSKYPYRHGMFAGILRSGDRLGRLLVCGIFPAIVPAAGTVNCSSAYSNFPSLILLGLDGHLISSRTFCKNEGGRFSGVLLCASPVGIFEV